MNRRKLLNNLIAAPYVARLGVLMPIHAFIMPPKPFTGQFVLTDRHWRLYPSFADDFASYTSNTVVNLKANYHYV